MRATTEFVRDVTIVEFLHHLKLDMRLVDVTIHEESFSAQAQILD